MLALGSSFAFTYWFCSLLLQSQICIHTDMNSLHQCISFYSDMEFLRSHQYLKTNNFVTIYCIYIIQLLFFAKKNIKLRFLVCSIIPCIFYFKVLSLDWQLIYKRILIQWYHLLISQFSPSKPCLHSHRYEFTSSTHFPLFRQGVPSQSSISENKQFRYKCFAETDKN